MRAPESHPEDAGRPLNAPAEDGGQDALYAALQRFRLGEDLHKAAAAEGIAAWRLLEEAQALPDPAASGLAEGKGLEPFVRRR